MELDFCCSGKLAKKMQESVGYEIIHLLFRVSEVLSRTVMHVMFVLWMKLQKPFIYYVDLCSAPERLDISVAGRDSNLC